MPDTPVQDLLRELNSAASGGDWNRLEEIAALLPSIPQPDNDVELNNYLFSLQTSIVSARTVRADIMKSLHRLSAASSFNQCG